MKNDESYWDEKLVRTYVHNSEMQRRWAIAFLADHLKGLKGDERVLDVGCGDGRITADLSRFVPGGFATGIDPSEAMLDWAGKQYHSLEYPNLSFKKGGFLNPGKDQFDLVISCCAFQQCPEQERGLSRLADLVKPGGKLLLTMPASFNPAWNQAAKNIQAAPKWSRYWQGGAQWARLSAKEIASILESKGFTVHARENHTKDPFIDREELAGMLRGIYPSVLPEELEGQFFQELIDEYLRLRPEGMESSGVIYLECGYISIAANL